jgi:NAD(P)-dependent dehydrogenase (short-subunit alcohol dehydrogenase family)
MPIEYSNYCSLSLKGKTAIVTGAIGTLGKYFCSGLGEAGANIVILDLDLAGCEQFAEVLKKKYDIQTIGLYCDVTQPESVHTMLDAVKKLFPSIDILLNNASYRSKIPKALHAPFEEYTLDEWIRMMAVNVNGPFLCCQAVGSLMREQQHGGSIINIASIYGMLGTDHRIYPQGENRSNNPASYSAAKGAILSLTRYLATYWGANGIRVNSISPGGVANKQNDEFISRYSERVPMGRMARPEEMVATVIYLASNASSYVTGQNLVIDGGLSAW